MSDGNNHDNIRFETTKHQHVREARDPSVPICSRQHRQRLGVRSDPVCGSIDGRAEPLRNLYRPFTIPVPGRAELAGGKAMENNLHRRH